MLPSLSIKNVEFQSSNVYDHTTCKKRGSRLITVVKSGWALLLLQWVTVWEYYCFVYFQYFCAK